RFNGVAEFTRRRARSAGSLRTPSRRFNGVAEFTRRRGGRARRARPPRPCFNGVAEFTRRRDRNTPHRNTGSAASMGSPSSLGEEAAARAQGNERIDASMGSPSSLGEERIGGFSTVAFGAPLQWGRRVHSAKSLEGEGRVSTFASA